MPTVTDKRLLETLEQVTVATLENFAFMFAEGVSDEQATPLPADADYIMASVLFLGGNQSGSVLVAMPVMQCMEMAADVLGITPDDLPENAPSDAIQEWVNIVGGALTAALFGLEVSFTLSAPVAKRMEPSAITALRDTPGTIALQVDDHVVLAQLELS